MEAILKNQLRQVSLAVSFTSSTVKPSEDVLQKEKLFMEEHLGCLTELFKTLNISFTYKEFFFKDFVFNGT